MESVLTASNGSWPASKAPPPPSNGSASSCAAMNAAKQPLLRDGGMEPVPFPFPL